MRDIYGNKTRLPQFGETARGMFQPAPVAPAAPKPDIIEIGGNARYARKAADMTKENLKGFKPSGRDNISGPAYTFLQGLRPFQEKYAADKESEKQRAMVDALKASGGWKDEEVALLMTGEPTIIQGLMNARNKREFLAAKTAADIKLAERKAELKVANGAQGGSWSASEIRWMEMPDGTRKAYAYDQKAPAGKNLVPLELPEGARLVTRTEIEADREGKKAGARQREKDIAKAAPEYRKVLAQSSIIERSLAAIENDPLTKEFVGMLQDNVPVISEEAAGWRKRIDQLAGQTFLQAYNDLRGGGQITEAEGAKAEAAYARLTTSQSYPEFLQALNDLRHIVKLGVTRAAADAGDKDAQERLRTVYSVEEAQRVYDEQQKKIDDLNKKRDRNEGTPPQPTAEDVRKAWKAGDEVAPGIVFKGPSGG